MKVARLVIMLDLFSMRLHESELYPTNGSEIAI